MTVPVLVQGELAGVDLIVDAVYQGGRAGNASDDPIAKIVPVGNQGGFRYAGSPMARTVRLVTLVSSGRDLDWPDTLDEQSGTFVYYGDNKAPGRELHDTSRRGNALLRDMFAGCHGSADDRRQVPPLLLFTATGEWRDVRFRGLLAPGTPTATADDDLQAIWRTKNGLRFQNYRAQFSVLDVPRVPRQWLDEVLTGITEGPHCPPAWRMWIEGRAYQQLLAPPTTTVREREQQLPATRDDAAILAAIVAWFEDDPHQFEQCAVELWRMMAPATGPAELTPRSRDGGRDAIGRYMLGPAGDQIGLEFALEAKCYAPTNPVGVREVSRLISRIRHRMFGVLVTTSYLHRQACEEVRTDGHPIVLISGRDIVEVLKSHGYTTETAVMEWLRERFPKNSVIPDVM
jgi:hypothetical protein